MKRVIITGAAGFIGFHVAKIFLKKNWEVLGVDSMSAYYDVELKRRRISILSNNKKFYFKKLKLEHSDKFLSEFRNFSPNIVIHLAAQAGVRYSIDNPKEYVNSNLVGTFNLLEASKEANLDHLMLASTSSVYGANTNMPFREIDRTDHQMSFYAATKKSNEVMSHSYSHLFCIPTTCFRFFTVYGPWGRPDMAPMIFANIDDLALSIEKLVSIPPNISKTNVGATADAMSPVAPWRVVNIGSSKPGNLMDFITEIENNLGKKASKNFLEMQAGDVEKTFADTRQLKSLILIRSKSSEPL